MSKQLGRISGPLLNANLLRDGTDLRFQNQLLYLDVTSKTLSINSTPINKELFVNGTLRTDFIIIDAPKINVGNLEIGPDNLIKATSGTVIMNGDDYVLTNEIQTLNLSITDNSITATTLDSQIEFRPTGTLEVYANTNITGNLHSTGDITADGSIIFGNNASDNVVFDADVNSSIIPDLDLAYSLGSDLALGGQRWADIYSKQVNGQSLEANTISSAGLSLILRPGKTWFVATNGDNTNRGNHENSPYATVAKALSVAVSGDTIHIYPGSYTEVFPLTVPAGVTVKGISIRSVTIQPTADTKSNDAFLLNGETTVSDLTVGNFYYNSGNNTGYGFRLAPNCLVTTRSPYVQNVTVLNNKTAINFQSIIDGEYSTSAIVDILNGGDSAGVFADITDGSPSSVGDPGRGALIDGAVVNASSKEATILFNAVTMIVPDADGITATNGARVEWLTSFTYFAYRGIYLLEGTLGFASQGTRYGAEIRSINSANIYGTYGVVADGANTLGYLIGHNFGYIGSGLDSSNDRTLMAQANEIVELNNGKIYFQSVDQQGNYRVGKEFFVDFDNGTTSIDISSGAINGISSLVIRSESNQTFIDYSKIDIGDFTLRDNDILTRSQSFNVVSATGESNLTQNIQVAKDLYTGGNITVGGTLTVGNQTGDTVNFTSEISSNILPKTNGTYNLGSITPNQKWKSTYSVSALAGNITLSPSGITTTSGNLLLTSTGKIKSNNTNLVIDPTLTVFQNSYFTNLVTTGNILHTGNYIGGVTATVNQILQTEDFINILTENSIPLSSEDTFIVTPNTITRTGNTYITGNAVASAGATLANIQVSNTTLSSTSINLESATGNVSFKSGTNILTFNGSLLSKKLQFVNTGSGYIKFANMGAIALPIGNSATRESAPEIGQFRINNNVVIEFVQDPVVAAEVYSGNPSVGDNGWIPARGLATEITYEEVEATLSVWGLILG